MSAKTRDLGLTKYDDLFSSDESRAELAKDKVEDVDRSLIDAFPNHPFKVRMDNAMNEMVESVKRFGVLVPAIIRPKDNGRYEMVAGHRRDKASELADIRHWDRWAFKQAIFWNPPAVSVTSSG